MSGNDQPVIILVQPQMGENIGMCARAMLNCGLTCLRLVSPRDGWPQESAKATAADADVVIENAEVYATLDEAVADCHQVFATTARERAGGTKVVPVREAAEAVKRSGSRVALLFGPEASGLDREAVSRANLLVRFPTNPDFPSLNLAQAVLLFGWEWRNLALEIPELSGEVPAPCGEVAHFIERLERELDASGFFNSEEMKPHSVRQIRSIFHRASPTGQEVKLLHGMVSAFRRERDSSET
ncbi:MAG: RNA methyltransferase [Verrucomicrobiales bacterium]|nr:RNA methyltransferase [Verrucomicrobiales bacterium]